MMILFIATAIILIGICVWLFVFNIYEVKYDLQIGTIKSNSNIEIKFDAIPLNSFGKKAPFRSVEFKYEIDKSSSVSVNSTSEKSLVLNFDPSFKQDDIKIKFISKYSREPVLEKVKLN